MLFIVNNRGVPSQGRLIAIS
ncbi:hypothetical protein [Nitrosospira sp. Is2]